MGVSGNLKSMLPGDLLQWLSLGQKTGTLVVTNGVVEKKIFFRRGRVISSASNDPREYLGQFLMSHGYLTEPELKKAMEVQQQSRILLGKILVMIDAIREEDLVRLMRLKAEESIYDIFLWQDGEFRFIDDELPPYEMIPLQVDVTGIILEGTRRVDEWARMRELIPGESLVPVVERAIADSADRDDADRTILNAIDGRRTIAEIVLETRSSSFRVAEAIFPLVREGSVRLVSPPKAPVDERAQAVILSDLSAVGLSKSKVPRVARSLDDITDMNFTPSEGFMLSRINGQWDIGSLIKISPIREPDAMRIFYRLWKDGVIALD